MSDSYLDHIPSHEREKIRKRLRSPEEYERLRDVVKGPEDLERELERGERMAELHFTLESEPKFHDKLKEKVEEDMREQGIEAILETPPGPDAKKALEQGKFRLTVSAHPSTHQDQLTVIPEGKVQEKLPIKQNLGDAYAGVIHRDV
jgi:hypothetical protein